jgi:hypothetical protein
VEADDERESSWGYSDSDMGDFEDPEAEMRYAEEDTRPTSQKELWGWYAYGWAAEVFAICAMGEHQSSALGHEIILTYAHRVIPPDHPRATG